MPSSALVLKIIVRKYYMLMSRFSNILLLVTLQSLPFEDSSIIHMLYASLVIHSTISPDFVT